MGCDIHFQVEKRTVDGWVRAEPLVRNVYYSEHDMEPEFVREDFYDARNYSLFAMLANVRNHGFINPIDQPRGYPEDVSAEVAKGWWNEEGHSHSWFSLRELLEVPWHTNTLVIQGVVEAKAFARFDKWGQVPYSYSGGVAGAYVHNVSNDEMRKLIANGTIDPDAKYVWGDPHYYTQIEWTQTWAEVIGDFSMTMVRMAAVAASEGLGFDDVRAVFSFDN